MGLIVYRDKDLQRHLKEAKKRGGIAAEAVRKAEDIIVKFYTDGQDDPVVLHRYIGKEEHRIKGCRKIYLQGGYRLIFIHQDNYVIFCYFGEHNDCFRWAEANRKLRYPLECLEIDAAGCRAVVQGRNEYTELWGMQDFQDMEEEPIVYDTPHEIIQERLYLEQYEEYIMNRIRSPEGQRAISRWFV